MDKKTSAAGLGSILGDDPGKTLLRMGSMAVVRKLVRAADRYVEESGGAPWTPAVNRAKRTVAATVRRRAGRSGLVRGAARSVAAGSRPSLAQRRAMRRDSYARQAESLSDEQLISIPASDLPPDLVRRRKAAAENRSQSAEAPKQNDRRAQIEAKIRKVIGDPDALPPNVRAQLEKEIAEKFADELGGEPESAPPEPPASADIPRQPPTPPPPQPAPAERKREDVQAVVDAQLRDQPQPKPEKQESGGWLDKLQTGLDVAGAVEPTPIADGTNVAISLGRAAFDPERRREHLQNAAISTVSAVVPYVGDTAKLLKAGRAGNKARAAKRATPPGGMKSTPGAPPVQTAGGAARPPGDMDSIPGPPPVQGGGTGGPPRDHARFGAPTPDDDGGGDSERNRRDDVEGIIAHDKWTDKLKTGAVAMASFVGKAYLAVESLKFLNQGVLALNKDLAQYNGTLAGSYARAETADIRRDMRRGESLSGPISKLQEEQTELKDSLAELTTPAYGTMIAILAKITELANIGLTVVKALYPLDLLRAFYDKYIANEDDEGIGAWEFLHDVSDGKFDGFDAEDFSKRFPHWQQIQDSHKNRKLG